MMKRSCCGSRPTARNALRDDENVWLHSKVLKSKHLACTAKACHMVWLPNLIHVWETKRDYFLYKDDTSLHFIKDKKDIVIVAELADSFHE